MIKKIFLNSLSYQNDRTDWYFSKAEKKQNYVVSDIDNKICLQKINVPCSHGSIREIWNTMSLWILLIYRIIWTVFFFGVQILPNLLYNFQSER
jgi:hypothetical protein